MNKALVALVLLGLAAVAQAQFDYQTNFVFDDKVVSTVGEYPNYIERGVDCGDLTIAGATKAPLHNCKCFSDLTRKRDPPVLLNQNSDRLAGDVRETGIVPAAEFGDPADLEIAVTLDYGVFRVGHPDLAGQGPDGENIVSTGTVPLIRQLQGLSGARADAFHGAASYFEPELEFFVKGTDVEGKTIDVTQPDCRWSLDASKNNYATANLDTGATPNYLTTGNAYANCDADGDSKTSSSILWVRKPVTQALADCGFTTAPGEVAGDHGISPPGGAVVSTSTFTIYTGTFKVTQWVQGGALNGQEVAKKEEYPFTIKLAFPENIQVTSDVISVIGKAEYQSTITHSIYESEDAKKYVNVNALFGTTFPFAVSETATFGSDTYSLALQADSPACAGFVSLRNAANDGANTDNDAVNLYNQYCTDDGKVGGTPVTVQSQTNYRLATPVLCDLNNNGVCDLADVFDLNTEYESGKLFKSGPEVQAFFGLTGADNYSPAESALVAARCTGINYGGGSTDTVNGMACLQNLGLRLKPNGWCDLNVNLEITINTVCRDDANGDDTKDDSLIDGTTMTVSGGSGYDTIVTPESPNPFLPVSDANLLQQGPSNTDTLECKSSQYAAQQDPKHKLAFSLRSDDFCPRVVATADVSANMIVYPSEFGAATWGARLSEHAGEIYGDVSKINTEIIDVDNSRPDDSDCVAQWRSNKLFAGYVNNPLCLQVPLMADGFQTQADSGVRAKQSSFVYGTTAYLETTLNVEAGVNVLASTIDELYVGRKRDGSSFFPAPSDVYQTIAIAASGTGRSGGPAPTVDEAKWLKQLIVAADTVASDLETWRTDIKDVDVKLTQAEVALRVKVSDSLLDDSMLKAYDVGQANSEYGANVAQTNKFFTANPCVGAAGDDPELADCANQGLQYNGVSRASVFLDDYTVYISDDAREAAEEIQFWAKIGITYQAADEQGNLRGAASKTSQAVPSGYSDRARLMAASAVSGGQASTSGSMSVSGQAGSGGSSSTIAGFSSTTVLAVAAVLGAVVVAAGASFFVVRKRNAAAKSAKRSSSSTELNDTLAVQA